MRARTAGRRTLRGGIAGVLAVTGLLLACGDTPAPDRRETTRGAGGSAGDAGATAAENRAPVVEWVEVDPSRPQPGQRVTASVQAHDPDGDPIRFEYRWRLNGREIGQGASAVLTDARRGDRIQVQVLASDGRASSEAREGEANVANQPPRLYAVKLEAPDGVRVGKSLTATPDAADPDEDDLSYRFEWRVNGEARGDEASFSLEGLRRGDEVVAVAWASDGEDESDPVESQVARIGNAPPEIVSKAAWERDGDTFRYAVKAEDPDGDRTLRYRLLRAPSGMTIDSLGGLVTWTPQRDQVGSHAVEIEVDDLQGGKTVQTVQVTIDLQADPAQPAASPDS